MTKPHVIIRIETSNQAFEEPGPEVARILRKLADTLDHYVAFQGRLEFDLRDSNGNTVGKFRVAP